MTRKDFDFISKQFVAIDDIMDISDFVKEQAWKLLILLEVFVGVSRPHVNPTPAGGLQFEWEKGSKYLEIEIDPDEGISYFYKDSEKHEEIEKVIPYLK